ncbi:MAG TPA: nickel-binding protein [Methylomirabilota bacterium]|jgi:hypothetical protein
MPLFVVERDLSQVPPERFRAELQSLVAACARLQGLGKKVRYISSAVFPAEARGLCLFGAEEQQWIHEANEAARLPYSRISAVLDLTPNGVCRDLSRGRRPARADADPGTSREGHDGAVASRVPEEIARWSTEGHQLLQALGGWLDEAGRLQHEVAAVESARAAMAAEARRLKEDNEGLRAQREELLEALQTLAGHMTRTADQILDRFGGRREAPGDLAPR